MTPLLTSDQRQALEAEHGAPLAIVDEQTQRVYYLISAEQFESLRSFIATDPFEAREMYPLIAKTAADAGWNDPRMDAYDHYDANRIQR